MPVTPDVARPMGRRASSSAVKRRDWPWREISMMSSSVSTSMAETSSSSSRRLMAITPAERLVS